MEGGEEWRRGKEDAVYVQSVDWTGLDSNIPRFSPAYVCTLTQREHGRVSSTNSSVALTQLPCSAVKLYGARNAFTLQQIASGCAHAPTP